MESNPPGGGRDKWSAKGGALSAGFAGRWSGSGDPTHSVLGGGHASTSNSFLGMDGTGSSTVDRPWSLGMGSVGGGASSPYTAPRPASASRGSRLFGGGLGAGATPAANQQPQQFGGSWLGGERTAAVTPGQSPWLGTAGLEGYGGIRVSPGQHSLTSPSLSTGAAQKRSSMPTPILPPYPHIAPQPNRAPTPGTAPFTSFAPSPPQPYSPSKAPYINSGATSYPTVVSHNTAQIPQYNPTPMPSAQYNPTPMSAAQYNPTPMPAAQYKPTPMPAAYLPTPIPQLPMMSLSTPSYALGTAYANSTPALLPAPYPPGAYGQVSVHHSQAQQQQQQQLAVAVPDGSIPASRKLAFREALQSATSPPPQPGSVLSHGLPPQAKIAAAEGTKSSKWTAKYLKDSEIHEVVNTLLELAFSGPHPALRVGKVVIHITPGPCEHVSGSSLIAGGMKQQLRGKMQAVRVHNLTSGWSCEFPIRPNCDITLFDKFSCLAEQVQDNWFVLCAILKDQFGVLMAEDSVTAAKASSAPQLSTSLLGSFGSGSGTSAGIAAAAQADKSKPQCPACKRVTLAITLHKVV